ncbi:MAG: hypothetical protein NWE98_01465 [Candidatus Bathyarchaeota archaeon]|nr:hypothetical protein [Candidatus Bathyarchaeota archaeon]
MFVNDVLQVIYAPKQAFKRIVENPKYLGAIVILVLFIGIQVGYEYAQFSKTYTEQVSPLVGELNKYTNATYWRGSQGVTVTNNAADSFNYTVFLAGYGFYPNLFGNTSLQIQASNISNFTASIENAFNVDCSEVGFQNLSMVIKPIEPQTPPQEAILTLYSLTDTDYYQYNLTPMLADATVNTWNNLTIPIGKSVAEWTTTGNPTWSNITALQLSLAYPTATNVTMRFGALFFRGQYLTPIQYNSTGILLEFLQAFSLQFLVTWFLFSAIIYLIFKALKTPQLWKPLFIAIGFALVVMVIRALINVAATLALSNVYYPFDVTLGVNFTPWGAIFYPPEMGGSLFLQSQAAIPVIEAATSTFNTITGAMTVVSYVWLGALVTLALGALKPEVSFVKRIAIAGGSLGITVVVMLFLIGIF